MVATFGRMLTLADKHEDRSRRIIVGADKTHNPKDFVVAARALNVTPHITKNEKGSRSEPRWQDDQAPPVTASA
jgi:hypothetical protein